MEPRFVLHPHVVLGIEDGRLFITRDVYQLATPDVEPALAVITCFLTSTSMAAAAAVLAARDFDAMSIVDALVDEGLVVPEATAAAAPCDPAASLRNLAQVVDLAHAIAGDVAGFGAASAEVTRGLHATLQRVVAELAGVSASLREARAGYLAGQVSALAPAAARKLHLGAADRRLDGWVNIDVPPAQFGMDLRWGLPFGDGSASHVFLSHFLEHLSRAEARRLMADIHRVLGAGGVVRVIVPSFRRYAEAYVRRDARFFEVQRAHWGWAAEMRTDLERILQYAAGADPDPRTFMTFHRYGYDFETLAALLADAGFARVEESGYMASRDPVLRVDDQTAYAGVSLDGRAFSLFVEATK